jgi:uncharacterized SAM-binding protein YcdF (DUF218 family)
LPILPLSRSGFTLALDSRSERSVSHRYQEEAPLIWLLQLKTLLRDLILPPAGPLILALLGLALLKVRPLLGRTCLIAGLASLWLLSTPIVSDALTGLAELYPPLDFRQAGTAQAIVILGGGGQRALAPEYAGPAAEPFLLERLSYGAYVANKTGLPILVTGFSVEAHAMHDSLQRNFGIETRCIDDQAYDTFQNARNSARILTADGVHRIVVSIRQPFAPALSLGAMNLSGAPIEPAWDVGRLKFLSGKVTRIEALLPSCLDSYYPSRRAIQNLSKSPG